MVFREYDVPIDPDAHETPDMIGNDGSDWSLGTPSTLIPGYGVHDAWLDLTGNIWQWTDEFQDEHTRAAVLRGGAYYRPAGSRWYFPSAYRLDEHGKYLLIGPSKDRAGTLGFRCVKDAE